MKEVRVRIAPSPTGFAHIGTIYQVLFDYAYAKQSGGRFVIRIEDTDRARFVEGAEQVIYDSLSWFGLIADEDPIKGGPYAPYRQSERLDIYREYVDKLIAQEDAYYCFCTKERLSEMRQSQESAKQSPMYDRACLNLSNEEIKHNLEAKIPRVVRMKVPRSDKITVTDAIVGDVVFDASTIDDQVILKSDGFPTYHLAVVVDDHLMKITHIFRGTEWLPSTPKHLLLYKFFGWEDIPTFIHLPLILNTNGQGKLSKRESSSSVEFYKKEGFLPEAILNYLSNIVWHHPEGHEIYSLEEFIKLFEISDLQSKGARFDLNKLEWMNGEYIRQMSNEELTTTLENYLVDHPSKTKIADLVPLVKERMKKLSDFIFLTNFLFEEPEYEKAVFAKILGKSEKSIDQVLEQIIKTMEEMPVSWESTVFEARFRQLGGELGLSASQMFQLIRAAVSGQTITPPLFECLKILGESSTLNRVKKLQAILSVV